jgi:nucleoside-diphosphate-sugar epimerase
MDPAMNLKDKNILVTGGAGAIGGALAARLAELSNNVIVLDNLSSGFRSNVSSNVEFIEGNILDDNLLFSIFKTGIVVVHLAACFANQNSIQHPIRDLTTNGVGTLKLLEYAVKFKAEKFVYASSSCVKDLNTPYALSKKLGEDYVSLYHERYNLNTTVLRYYNSYGPGDRSGKYRSVIPNFIYSALKEEDITITGDGSETRDFTYVDDIVEGTVLACTTDLSGEVFSLGSGKQTKIIDLACMVKDKTRSVSEIIFTDRRDWDTVDSRIAGIKSAKEKLGYSPKTDLKQGLEKTINWLKKELR